MSTHKYIDRICCAAVVFALLLTVIFMNAESFGIQPASTAKGYESRLFDTDTVHSLQIIMDDWEEFLDSCTNEEYVLCSVIIDGETYKNVGIRAKGNTSLTQVASYGNDRYSFKIEFDHYDSTKSYYGLDKLNLNNIIQDNTYMKDYLSYQMMAAFGVSAPLCSYVYITVNGEDWGLYLAVEGVEEAFLERNYGSDYGELYKPDSQNIGGGHGDGGAEGDRPEFNAGQEQNGAKRTEGFDMPEFNFSADGAFPSFPFSDGFTPDESLLPDTEDSQAFSLPSDFDPENAPGTESDTDSAGGPQSLQFPGGMGGMGGDDVSLIYSDDDPDSYSNIFDNAKTDVTSADQQRLIASLKQLNEQENIEQIVNVDQVIRYFVVHNFVCNFDSYTGSIIHNYYLYEEDGQLSMIPWDYNLAFGGFQSAQDATELVNYPVDTPVSGGTVDSRPMLAWIFSNQTYTDLYHQYFSEFISSYFESGYFSEMIDDVQAMIAPYVQNDPTKFCTYEEFETGVATLKEFCLLRAESVRGQLDGTIASTSQGQSQDSDSLIDASGITISDMGSMGNMGGMGGGRNRSESEFPDMSVGGFSGQTPSDTGSDGSVADPLSEPAASQTPQDTPSAGAPPSQGAGVESASNSGMPTQDETSRGMFPSRFDGETAWDFGAGQETAQASSAQTWVELGINAAVLLAGILIAALYKKRV